MLELKEIYDDSDFDDLRVAEDQKEFVADIPTILARAYLFRRRNCHLYLICDGGEPVGMVLYYDYYDQPLYHLAELFIDERYQRRGYGTAAAEMVLQEMREDGRFPKVYLFYQDGNEGARRLYEKLGFRETVRGETEVGMELEL